MSAATVKPTCMPADPATTVKTTSASVVSATTAVEAITYVTTTSTPSAPAASLPGAGADEDAIAEPLRSIVAVGCTGIGRICIVAVRTYGRRSLRVTPSELDSK